jgi:carbamoyltransferase
MYLGINLSHDASAALMDEQGAILYAVSEERLSRVKNHIGIPLLAIAEIFDKFNIKDLDKIIIGSHEHLTSETVNKFLAQEKANPSNPRGRALDPFPGFKMASNNPKNVLSDFLKSSSKLKLSPDSELIFLNHHDSHLGCGIPSLAQESGLILSLDGEGDGESGAISIKMKNERMRKLARFSSLDSLGLLYAAVTKKYNFKPLHHEGKITGLAAYGKYSSMVDELLKFVIVENGQISLKYSKNRLMRVLGKTSHSFGITTSTPLSIDHIIEMLDDSNTNYPDLAFAVQFVLEKSVEEIVRYWIGQTGVHNISLTGGVFANVKVNQKLSEMEEVESVFVFPNMGDGGIAIGGVWSWMENRGLNISGDAFNSMYLGTTGDARLQFEKSVDLTITEFDEDEIASQIAKDISTAKVVAIINGSMEFGPRALGNTSILLDPRDPEIVKSVNLRLKRTEFMPFAPSVMEEYFHEYFETGNQSLQPFYYMAMTCNVALDKRNLIPAVTHIDGTARPQIVSKNSNLFFHQIIENFRYITGIPVLVNTSFNIHEEPIIRSAETAIVALRQKAVDIVYVGNSRVTLLN